MSETSTEAQAMVCTEKKKQAREESLECNQITLQHEERPECNYIVLQQEE